MKLFVFLLFLLSTYILAKQPNYLKKNRVLTQAEFFLFDGETFQQEPPPSFKNYIGNCYVVYNSTIYDLHPISKNPIPVPSKRSKERSTVFLDLCNNALVTRCPANKIGILKSSSYYPENQGQNETCKLFAGSSTSDKTWIWENSFEYTLSLPEGDTCLNDRKYKTSITLKCNSEAKVPVVLGKKFDETKCDNKIVIESAFGKIYFFIF